MIRVINNQVTITGSAEEMLTDILGIFVTLEVTTGIKADVLMDTYKSPKLQKLKREMLKKATIEEYEVVSNNKYTKIFFKK